MNMKNIYTIMMEIGRNPMLKIVVFAVVFDTFFGCMRAIRQRCFNSCVGIDGAIRKISMIMSLIGLAIVDMMIKVNLIGFIPEEVREYLPCQVVGFMEFFAIVYIAYEAVSILKNMYLSGLPVKKIWILVKKFLGTYTDELPDDDGII